MAVFSVHSYIHSFTPTLASPAASLADTPTKPYADNYEALLDVSIAFACRGWMGGCILSEVQCQTQSTQSGNGPLLAYIHSIMLVKSGQPGEGRGCTPFPFHSIYHHVTSKVVVYVPDKRADTIHPYFSSTPMWTLWCQIQVYFP